MRSLQFRVVVNHATDSFFVFDDASVTIAPRDPTLVSTLKVEKQGAGWLVSQYSALFKWIQCMVRRRTRGAGQSYHRDAGRVGEGAAK